MKLTKLAENQIAQLVKQAQADDKEAFGKIYDEFITPIYRYIFYRVEHNEVEDLTEQVFLQALRKIKNYQPQPRVPFAAWLFRIAHNLIIDHYRFYNRLQQTNLSEDLVSDKQDDNPTHQTEQKFTQNRLARAIRKLPDNQQQVIILKFIHELENPEIANLLAKSVSAIRLIQFRALKNLKITLDKKELSRNKNEFFTFKILEQAKGNN